MRHLGSCFTFSSFSLFSFTAAIFYLTFSFRSNSRTLGPFRFCFCHSPHIMYSSSILSFFFPFHSLFSLSLSLSLSSGEEEEEEEKGKVGAVEE